VSKRTCGKETLQGGVTPCILETLQGGIVTPCIPGSMVLTNVALETLSCEAGVQRMIESIIGVETSFDQASHTSRSFFGQPAASDTAALSSFLRQHPVQLDTCAHKPIVITRVGGSERSEGRCALDSPC
jgi:hypothetical protein